MTDRASVVVLAALASFALGACSGAQKTPAQPHRAPSPSLETLQEGGEPALRPYLDAYPLGERGSRVDLLAATSQRSMHLVQVQRSIPRHYHKERVESVYVLTGSGVCYIGDKSYPVAPGAAFRIAPGVVHHVAPHKGSVVVAISYFEPPMVDVEDRVLAD
jgi:mannose-6-phosphate isomerase-like protein (cupin superfamily)